jgi:multidrug efflux pump subunit AcrB
MKNRRIFIILSLIVAILLIPLIAMQFTDEVNWTAGDFAIMGILLLVTGFFYELVMRIVTRSKYRVILVIAIILVFLLIWAELAVGIFGTPFAGS